MTLCEQCKKEHDGTFGSGRFCRQRCARIFAALIRREETNQKVSLTMKEKFKLGELKMPLGYRFKKGFDEKRRKFTIEDGAVGRKKSRETVFKRISNTPFESLHKSIRIKLLIQKQQGKCKICSINRWVNKPIKLQLDHIDGNKYNNKEENCRMICPNCHSQTETFCGKNKGRYKIGACGPIRTGKE